MTVALVSEIDMQQFGGDTVRLGDLNRDGAYELLFIQSDPCTRAITCLTATDILGNILWQNGTPLPEHGIIYSDLAVQIYDWDGDGRNEVLWVEQAIYAEAFVWDYYLEKHVIVKTTRRGELNGRKGCAAEGAQKYEGTAVMHVLDGASGKEKTSFPIPAPADDCFAFANLTGGPTRRDLVVKDRYWNVWGLNNRGQELWHYANSNPGHYPLIADIDDDGLDEVFVGWDMIDHDGSILWSLPGPRSHQDSAHLVSVDGQKRLIFSHGEGEGLNGGVHCLTTQGKELWAKEFGHAQIVIPGRFKPDLGPIQFAVSDLGWVQKQALRTETAIAILNADGTEIARKPYPDGTVIYMTRIDWLGNNQPHCLAVAEGGPFNPETKTSQRMLPVIQDADGTILESLKIETEDDSHAKNYNYVGAADLCGDAREEALVTGPKYFRIFTNSQLIQKETFYNASYYKGC